MLSHHKASSEVKPQSTTVTVTITVTVTVTVTVTTVTVRAKISLLKIYIVTGQPRHFEQSQGLIRG